MGLWIFATVLGICLGLTLFGCVRLRMYLAPIIRNRYGNGLRKVYWLVTIIGMVALANAALLGLRHYTTNLTPTNSLIIEIWFSVLALIVALTLVFRRINRNR